MLSASRRLGFGEGPIPVSEVRAFLQIRHPDFDVDECMEFLELIAGLEDVYFRVKKEMEPEKDDKKQDDGEDD